MKIYTAALTAALLASGVAGHRVYQFFLSPFLAVKTDSYLEEVHGILLVNNTETPRWKYVR